MKNITVSQLISNLNKLVKGLSIKGNHTDLHDKVGELIRDYVKSIGLSVKVWYVEYQNSEKGWESYNILTYNSDFTKDKRTSDYQPKGTFSNITFNINYAADSSLKLKDYITEVKIIELDKAIENDNAHVLKCEKELFEAQRCLMNRMTEKRQLLESRNHEIHN